MTVRIIHPNNDDGYAVAAPVGSYPEGASWVGAEDMSGNVWEWVHSLYLSYPYHPSYEDDDIYGTTQRVLRGGSYSSPLAYLRTAHRVGQDPDEAGQFAGFRCARPAG